jgi:hypothetical protein
MQIVKGSAAPTHPIRISERGTIDQGSSTISERGTIDQAASRAQFLESHVLRRRSPDKHSRSEVKRSPPQHLFRLLRLLGGETITTPTSLPSSSAALRGETITTPTSLPSSSARDSSLDRATPKPTGFEFSLEAGRGERIRTSDPLTPSQVR